MKSKKPQKFTNLMSIIKTASRFFYSLNKTARKTRNFLFPHRNSSSKSNYHQFPSLPSSLIENRKNFSLLFNFHTSLLRTNSLFPFFMLIAFEGGGLIKATLLLVTYPIVILLGQNSDLGVRLMVFVTFCGLKCRDMEVLVRAVLPKMYMEEMNRRIYEVGKRAKRRIVVSSLPRVMVERFVEECFGESEVLGAELEVVSGRYFTGRLLERGTVDERLGAVRDRIGEEKIDLGILGVCDVSGQLIVSCCKEVYRVPKQQQEKEEEQDRPKGPIFHDGRLAFLPTAWSSLALLLFLPFSVVLCFLRILSSLILPFPLCPLVAASLGLRFRQTHHPSLNPSSSHTLFVCTHRTLLDPIFLSYALFRPIPVVTYSLSPLSESLSPIPTVRLSRNRILDSLTMRRLLASNDLAVCPEGTTCREPYLLRFSPLFADIADNIQPVAINAHCSMFHATTATGMKCMDLIFFFMNPRPAYRITFLPRVAEEFTVKGGCPAKDVANRIQRDLARELGFQCTCLTRRDKYLLLAGTDGVVAKD